MDSERKFLLKSLTAQRHHVLGILEGLTEEDLRRPMLPSGWHCLGLVQHLTRSDEIFWFRAIVAGEDISHAVTDEMFKTEWQVPTDVSAGEIFSAYERAIERSDAIFEATPLDAPPAYWPEDQFPNWHLSEFREIVLHVITETACHAGHLDAARELIDGTQWVVM
jgi:Protein of unknown function (DUF664)